MTPITSLDALLYTVLGAALLWLGRIITRWIDKSTAERRLRTDRAAKVEAKNRLLTESLHDHRNEMLKSGQWTRDTLPPFIRKEEL